jgi:phosphoribulokinase
MKVELEKRYAAGDQTFSHFSYEANELAELERVFREYGETRHYIHNDEEGGAFGWSVGHVHRLARV